MTIAFIERPPLTGDDAHRKLYHGLEAVSCAASSGGAALLGAINTDTERLHDKRQILPEATALVRGEVAGSTKCGYWHRKVRLALQKCTQPIFEKRRF